MLRKQIGIGDEYFKPRIEIEIFHSDSDTDICDKQITCVHTNYQDENNNK